MLMSLLDPSSSVTRLVKSAPNTATPTAPPTARKKLTVDVATPRCSTGASFCTATTSTCSTMPIPTPRTAM